MIWICEKRCVASRADQLYIKIAIVDVDDKITGAMMPGKDLLKGFDVIIVG